MGIEERLNYRFSPNAIVCVMMEEYESVVHAFGTNLSHKEKTAVVRSMRAQSYHANLMTLRDLKPTIDDSHQCMLLHENDKHVLAYDSGRLGLPGIYAWGAVGFLSLESVGGRQLVRESRLTAKAFKHYHQMLAQGLEVFFREACQDWQLADEYIAACNNLELDKNVPFIGRDGTPAAENILQCAVFMAMGAWHVHQALKNSQAGCDFLRQLHDGFGCRDAYGIVRDTYKRGP